MTVLLAGGAGYIGSQMAHLLADHGVDAVVIDNLSTGRRDLLPRDMPFVEANVGDTAIVSDTIRKFDCTDIIHFAGSTVVTESLTAPLEYYRNNTGSTLALLQAAHETGVKRFVFSSSAAVYGDPATEQAVHEDQPTSPLSPYGWSKLFSEQIIADAGLAHGIEYAILRYFNVAGADPELRTGQASPHATSLIKIACEAATGKRDRLEIFGTDYPTTDGTCIRDFIHVCDLVDVHWRSLEHLRAGGRSVRMNCGYGHGISVRQVVDAICGMANSQINVVESARRPGDVYFSMAAIDRLRETLGWMPRYDDLETILQHALAWERRQSEMT